MSASSATPTGKDDGLSSDAVAGIILGILFFVLITAMVIVAVTIFILRKTHTGSYKLDVSIFTKFIL